MRRLLTRVGLPMLAAAMLAITNLPAAPADPSSGYEDRCGSPVHILPGVTATTCTHYSWWLYHEHWGYMARVIISNSSGGYTVNVRPDLLVGPTTYYGGTYPVAPGEHREFYGNMVEKPPRDQAKTGRGYFQVGSWSTYTHAPSFP